MSNENENEDLDLKQESEHDSFKTDPFDRLMFGPRGTRRHKNKVPDENSNQSNSDGVDLNHLMEQISDIMTSIDKIKPALKDLSPLLDYFRKK
ncbi:hypothetical protein ACFSFW_13455 [Fredinandcohnia salidurans]|uniref:Uncharacterized protein n=1 Tax=Fredinandcohnia salidurans TaxID=2595041 RepID=A0ABW4MRP4_9BACI